MIWLSSFPRSGNTFFRNLLFEVYGLESSSYYDGVGLPENYTEFPFVKTHMRPHEIQPIETSIPAVYLIRDGRDALVSMAHQRKDLYDSTTDFRENFLEAMVAAEESYFGGWSINSKEWLERCSMMIRYEDVVGDPLKELSRLNALLNLQPKEGYHIPTFEEFKFGKPKYGRGKRLANSEAEELEIVQKSFRKGKAFGWKDELDRELKNLFWSYHGLTMTKMGYSRDGGLLTLDPDFDYVLMAKLGQSVPKSSEKYSILIEANKLLMHQNDGVKRYLLELLKALYPVAKNKHGRWQIDVFLKGRVYPLSEYGKGLFDAKKNENHYNKYSRIFKSINKFIKFFIPKRFHETFSKYLKKVAVKAGLNFAKTIARIHYAKMFVKKGKEAAKEHFEAQRLDVELGRYDLVHVPLPQHFQPFEETKNNYLVTIHDMTHKLFSEYHTSSNVQIAEKGMQYFLKEKADFLCISESTRNDLMTLENVADERTHLVYEAADSEKFKPNLNSGRGLYVRTIYGIPDKPFLFALSTLEPRKNLNNMIEAFNLFLDENPTQDINLVIGGRMGWKSKDLLQQRHLDHIIFTGFIDENDLPILYNEAHAMCYLSFYEGFGLPPLEAMACKTPVLYGENSSLKELFEGYGLGAPADDIRAISKQMKEILTNDELREELREKALERSFDFTWRKTARETLDVYEKVIQKRKMN